MELMLQVALNTSWGVRTGNTNEPGHIPRDSLQCHGTFPNPGYAWHNNEPGLNSMAHTQIQSFPDPGYARHNNELELKFSEQIQAPADVTDQIPNIQNITQTPSDSAYVNFKNQKSCQLSV